jgi:leader peptidase (prepilin peptidase)/N-methyltransferase
MLFAGAAGRFGYNWELPAMLIFLAGLLALASIDLELMVLPKGIVFVTLAGVSIFLVTAAGVYSEWHRLLIASLCAIGWFLIFFLLWAISPRILGYGDVRLATLLGLALGWLGIRYVILGFFSANFIGAIIGIFLIATKKLRSDQPIPYGVFLALGAALAVYAAPELLAPFQRYG